MEKACPGRDVVGKLEALQVCLPESLERRAKPVMRTTLSPFLAILVQKWVLS